MSNKVFSEQNIHVCDAVSGSNKHDGGIGSVVLSKCDANTYGSTIRDKLRGVNNKSTILFPSRMDLPHGSITAVVGSSESGKSTLLKYMAGCSDTNLVCEGVVNLPGTSAYLPEETTLHRFYTPRTYIKHYDRLLCSGES